MPAERKDKPRMGLEVQREPGKGHSDKEDAGVGRRGKVWL